MSGAMTQIHQGRQQAVDDDELVLRPGSYSPPPRPGREPSLMLLMPQRPHLGDEFRDHIRRQPSDPVLRHDQLTRPSPHHAQFNELPGHRATANHARARLTPAERQIVWGLYQDCSTNWAEAAALAGAPRRRPSVNPCGARPNSSPPNRAAEPSSCTARGRHLPRPRTGGTPIPVPADRKLRRSATLRRGTCGCPQVLPYSADHLYAKGSSPWEKRHGRCAGAAQGHHANSPAPSGPLEPTTAQTSPG